MKRNEIEQEVELFGQQYNAYYFETQFGAVIAGVQSGKTFLGAHWSGNKITEFSGENGLICAPCYSDDTEILTERGWILFGNLSNKDKVACLVNGQMVFKKPKERYEWNFSGEMIGLKHSQVDLLVTPNHRIYFKDVYGKDKQWHTERAGNIFGRRIKLKRWAEWGDGKKQNENWYEFVGFWFAEGWAGYNEKDRKYRITLTQKNKCEYVDDLLIRNSLIATKEKRQNGGFNWVICNKELAKQFVQYGKALTKHIPQEIKDADVASLRALIKGFEVGDGKTSDKQRILYTSSKVLADDLQEICNKCGYAATIRKYNYSKWENPQYLISILKHYGKEPIIYKNQWHKQRYSGKVYCVKIDKGEGVLLVRRNGMSVWCGNTYKILQHSTLEKFFQLFPECRKYYKEQKGVIELPKGGKVFIRSADQPLGIEGMTIHWAWLDEAGMMSRLIWTVIRSRVSLTGGQVLITTTPYNMGWLYQEFYVPWKEGRDKDLSVFTWRSIDSPYFPKDFYDKEKARLRIEEFARRYMGEFKKMEGLVYDLPLEQIIAPIEGLTKKSFVGAGIDWGFRNPAAIGIGALYDNAWYIISDWKETERTTAEIIQVLKNQRDEFRIRRFYPDPAEPDRIKELKDAGINAADTNKNILGGISTIQQLIKDKRFFVFNTCSNFLDEINSYHYPEGTEGKPFKDEPEKINDHLMDAIRYLIHSYQPAKEIPTDYTQKKRYNKFKYLIRKSKE